MPTKKTVAIVGNNVTTRIDIPFARRYIDIWAFNEAVLADWMKRVDAIFQMHDAPIWKNPLNRNDGKFSNWIIKDHPYPIYMLDKYGEVPASYKYPLKEICDSLLPLFYRGMHKNKRILLKYFTSSVCYALALAIYKGYECIQLFGVEMESNTEYAYQRDGVIFWIGIALGKGIEVNIHPNSRLFSEPLYGYEGKTTLKRENFQERLEFLKPYIERSAKALEKVNHEMEANLKDALEDSGGEAGMASVAIKNKFFKHLKMQAQAVVNVAMLQASISEDERYILKADKMDEVSGDHFFARQEFELTGAQAQDIQAKLLAKMNMLGGKAAAAWDTLDKAVQEERSQKELDELSIAYGQAHEIYLKACFEYGHISGIYQENLHLLNWVDELIQAAGGLKAVEAVHEWEKAGNGQTEREQQPESRPA